MSVKINVWKKQSNFSQSILVHISTSRFEEIKAIECFLAHHTKLLLIISSDGRDVCALQFSTVFNITLLDITLNIKEWKNSTCWFVWIVIMKWWSSVLSISYYHPLKNNKWWYAFQPLKTLKCTDKISRNQGMVAMVDTSFCMSFANHSFRFINFNVQRLLST